MPHDAPQVSVVIPCYNYRHFLADAVDSALAQQGVDVEVIVVDDASTDGSADLAREIAGRDARVKVITHSTNAGHIATYNDGLAAASGAYLVLLSADDLLADGALARATALMRANPSVGLVYGRVVQLTTTLVPPPVLRRPRWRVWTGEEWLNRRARSGRNVIMCPEAVMRTDVYHEIGPYRIDLPQSADLAMWLAAARISDIGHVGRCDQAYYRIHGGNMHIATYGIGTDLGVLTDLECRAMAFNAELPLAHDGTRLLQLAREALALEALDHICAAYENGSVAREPIGGYLQFAEQTWPAVRSCAQWRTAQHRIHHGLDHAHHLSYRMRRYIRDLEDRLRWRRWRRTGNH